MQSHTVGKKKEARKTNHGSADRVPFKFRYILSAYKTQAPRQKKKELFSPTPLVSPLFP
jgi:hypothetical protein